MSSPVAQLLPGFLRKIGKKHVEIATLWLPTAMLYGTATGAAIIYASEWKTVLQYVPYYNGKYVTDE